MMRRHHRTGRPRSSAKAWQFRDEETLGLGLLGFLLLCLCVAGGASRASEFGQVIVRSIALLTMLLLCATRRTWTAGELKVPLTTITLIGAIATIQLVPLPPAIWTALPGRTPFEAAAAGSAQPWRPINLTPDAGLNTLLSLSVPLAVLAILTVIPASRRASIVHLMLGTVLVSALLGSLQLGGLLFNNPFINETVGEAAGIFANRNHQALFLACGIPLIWLWAGSQNRRRMQVRAPVAVGLTLWLLLLILAAGSRAGLGLGLLALAGSAGMFLHRIHHLGLRLPRWALTGIAVTALIAVGAVVLVGISSDKALSLRRLAESGGERDIRFLSLPVLKDLMWRYFPFGSGFGSFDPMFRIAEPFELLAPTYLNHAHNDAIEILIEAGLAGVALILLALTIWVRSGIRGWRALRAGDAHPIVGWMILSLVLAASLVDYPLRTPMIMALTGMAAWLSRSVGYRSEAAGQAALPS